MKIKKLELTNFKRFTHLTIDMTELVVAPKLVLLIGTNGSGKSSVFDGFEALNGRSINDYYPKNKDSNFSVEVTFSDGLSWSRTNGEIKSSESNRFPWLNNFYGRTSIRQVPRLTRRSSGVIDLDIIRNSDRAPTFIDKDDMFENDIENISKLIFKDVFKQDILTSKLREQYIQPINKAFENIFGSNEATSLRLISIIPALDGKVAEILFRKGSSIFQYDYLSSGEKEIFNIILNLLGRTQYFQDTIYFLDELDLHLNTFLQKNLIKEITENWIPENCQLWTASHSIGFIEYANESDAAAIIDLDSLDFDLLQTIYPSPKNNYDVFEIAVSKDLLSKIFNGKRIIFSENTDAYYYNLIGIQDTIFVKGNDKKDVFYKSISLKSRGLIDRDYLTDQDIKDIKTTYPEIQILEYYCFENYIYHPDNLEEYYKSINKEFDKINYKLKISETLKSHIFEINYGISGARGGYPFFKEIGNEKKLEAFKEEGKLIIELLRSEDFETFYKVFNSKHFGKEIIERQNLNKEHLAKTNWMKEKITDILK